MDVEYLPLKIKIFLWQICNDKIQSAEQLRKRNWTGPLECKLCGELESTEHIFLHCVVANFCWNIIRDALGWAARPVCMEDLWDKLVEGTNDKNRNFVYLLGCLAWSLWLTKNDFVFNDVLIASPDVSVFRTISFMQKWKILNKERNQTWIVEAMHKRKAQIASSRTED
jgi:hypothetical protein